MRPDKHTPLVSVIIPAYNRADVIGRALASVLAQTFQDFEIVVVDDASADRDALIEAVASAADSRIRTIHHETNRFAAAARNTGVRHARGPFIAFLDSDDEWMPEKLQTQLAAIAFDPSQDIVVHCAAEVLTTRSGAHNKSVMPERGLNPGESLTEYLFVGRGFLPTPSILVPTRLASLHPMPESLRINEDFDTLLRLEKAGVRFLFVSEPLVRVHWEDVHQSSRNFDPTVSITFLERNRDSFSNKAASRFVCSHLVHPLLGRHRLLEAGCVLRKYVRLRDLSPVEWVTSLSYLLCGDARLAGTVVKIKQFLTGGGTLRNSSDATI